MMGMDAEVENLRAAVSRHFTVSQITVNPFAVTFRVTSDPTAFDGAFDPLRKDPVPKNSIPSIVQEPRGEVIRVPRPPGPRAPVRTAQRPAHAAMCRRRMSG